MNMQALMQQAQKMQRDILKKKEEIDNKNFIGKSDWIEIEFKGNRDVKSVKILNDDAYDKENSDILSDMILLAIKDGLNKIQKETDDKMGQYGQMGGLF